MFVWFATGLFFCFLAFLMRLLPAKAALLIYGSRRRIRLTEKGSRVIDQASASGELYIGGAAILIKCLFDSAIWFLFH